MQVTFSRNHVNSLAPFNWFWHTFCPLNIYFQCNYFIVLMQITSSTYCSRAVLFFSGSSWSVSRSSSLSIQQTFNNLSLSFELVFRKLHKMEIKLYINDDSFCRSVGLLFKKNTWTEEIKHSLSANNPIRIHCTRFSNVFFPLYFIANDNLNTT